MANFAGSLMVTPLPSGGLSGRMNSPFAGSLSETGGGSATLNFRMVGYTNDAFRTAYAWTSPGERDTSGTLAPVPGLVDIGTLQVF